MIPNRRVPTLDLYLASTMRAGERLEHRLAYLGVDSVTLALTRSDLLSSGFDDPARVTPASVRTAFGEPSSSNGNMLWYDLVIWPAHRFGWKVLPHGRLAHAGFALREDPELPRWVPNTLAAVQGVLEVDHHTLREVRQLLGEPESTDEWGTMVGWYYRSEVATNDILLEFDYGLLRTINTVRHTDAG